MSSRVDHIVGGKPSYLPILATILLWPSLLLVAQTTPSDSTDLSDSLSLLDDLEPTLALTGSVGVSVTAYDSDLENPRREPLSWTVDGALDAKVGEIDIPIDFIFSEQERSFRQPFNQIGLSPGIGPIRLHLGYRSMYLSEYTLGATSFLGAGVEFNPGSLRLSGMYGRLQRAVEIDTAEDFVIPAYERWGYAFKAGFEAGGAEVSLIYFHALDDTASLVQPPTEIPGVRPQENSVVGLLLGFDIIPDKLRFEAEGAGSILSQDVRSVESDTADIPGILQSLQTVRNSTTLTIASKASLLYTTETVGVGFAYERIEPEYQSLGTYYFTTDVERFLLEPTFSLSEGTIRLSGSIGLEHDNLLNTRVAETSRIIGSAIVGWDVTRAFGFDANYLNFSTGQQGGREPLNDTIAVRSVSQSATLAPRLFLAGESATHFITLIGSLQDYTDLNAFTNLTSDSRSLTGNLVYSLGLTESPLTAGGSLLFGETTTSGIVSTTIGGSLNAGLSLLEGKLSLNGGFGLTRTTQDILGVETAADVLNENLSASFLLGSAGTLLFRLFATQSSGDLSQQSYFNELTAELGYRHRLDWKSDDEEKGGPTP